MKKYSGAGYPNGLRGENIPIYGRIVALCDVWDVLVSERPYKKAFSVDKALEIVVPDCNQDDFNIQFHLVIDFKISGETSKRYRP